MAVAPLVVAIYPSPSNRRMVGRHPRAVDVAASRWASSGIP
jgi:hypothetical protein